MKNEGSVNFYFLEATAFAKLFVREPGTTR